MVTVPGVREMLDGSAMIRWGQLCLVGLERHRDEINALNVFPVADADTGTNLLATMRAAVTAAEDALDAAASPHGTDAESVGGGDAAGRDDVREESGGGGEDVLDAASSRDAGAEPVGGYSGGGVRGDAGGVLAAMARAGTAGARGNSGIILSQVLRGLAEAVRSGPLTARNLCAALRRAAFLVREALSDPVEGTMLSVLEAAADRAMDCSDTELSEVARAAADGACKALGDTPAQLGVLRAAGVVDAGARGLLVVLDALVAVITGQMPVRQEYRSSSPAVDDVPEPPVRHEHSVPDDPAAPQYEVMYLLSETTETRIGELREHLARLGDSVVVVGDGAEDWSAHVHCADAGAAVEAGLAAGTLRRIRIEGLAMNPLAAQGPSDRGILAVVTGAGAARLFEDSGATVLDGEVTAEVLLAAIRRMPQREVLVLPNGALGAHELVAVGMAARGGAGAVSREVLMLPSGAMVQGLAALAVHDGGRIAVDDAFAMSEAAAGTRWGALRVAPERALTIVGTCDRGDGLGLVGNDVVVIDPDPRAAARTLLDRMLGLGGELVTLLLGADAPDELGRDLAEHITATFPGVEVVAYGGGQPVDLVQIGVE